VILKSGTMIRYNAMMEKDIKDCEEESKK